MSRIESRLKRLEKQVGKPGTCHCGRGGKPGAAVYYPDEGQPQPSGTCPECGGNRMIFAIVYESPQWPNYHGAEGMPSESGLSKSTNRQAGYE